MHELEEATGLPPRLIRFLVAEGVVPPPQGGRRHAEYGDAHLRAIRIYQAAKREGVGSLDVIRERVGKGGGADIRAVAPGIEVRIEEGAVAEVEKFINGVRKLARDFGREWE